MVRINLYEALQTVLNESVDQDKVIAAIENRNYVEINYVDEDSNAPGSRLIEPYAYGYTKAGNPVLRAYQISGDSLRGKPKWKFFRLDRIVSWKPRKQTFNSPPPMHGYVNAEDYNENGDRSMSSVIAQVRFNDMSAETSLDSIRNQTNFLKTAPKVSSGPVPFASQQRKKNVYTSQPNSKRYQQYAKNIDDTANEIDRFNDDIWAKADAERRAQDNAKIASTVDKPKAIKGGPVKADIDKEEEL